MTRTLAAGTAVLFPVVFSGFVFTASGGGPRGGHPLGGAFSLVSASSFPCPEPTPAPGDPTPTPPPSPGPTEFDVLIPFSFTNQTGQAVTDLHICMDRPVAGGYVGSNAPGCAAPEAHAVLRGRDIELLWPDPCVDPGESVGIRVGAPGSAQVHCYFWILNEVPLSSRDANSDADGDGWTHAAEDAIGTNPADPLRVLELACRPGIRRAPAEHADHRRSWQLHYPGAAAQHLAGRNEL